MTVQNTAQMILGCLSDTYRRGFMLFAIGLPAAALVIVPEFAQHVAEIQNGMFDSRAGAQAFANTPLRWGFGYVKLVGLVLAFLACARFWWTREHGGRWWWPGEIAWGRLFGAAAIIALVSLSTWPLRGHVQDNWLDIADLILSLLTLPLVFYMLSGLFGDRSIPLSVMLKRSWPWVVLLALLMIFAFAPPQFVHGLLHKWAIGQSRPVIWVLMIVDSVVVGLLASLVGAALYTAYDAMARRLRAPA
ncbi:hypothetical protein [Sphingomonas sp. LT1P40]|uniref:hypothetical protein n=1 Tax=Alteristakelama amylovorans TaxID=3096166 RepID=UPI002FC8C0B4